MYLPPSPSSLSPSPPLDVPASLSSFFLTPTCMYSLLQKNAGIFPPLIAIYVFVCSLYTLNILCGLFCSVLLSSHGPDGPELFMIDPSGVSWVKKIYIFNFLHKNKECSHRHETLNFVLKNKKQKKLIVY